jgi:hypothetical protein
MVPLLFVDFPTLPVLVDPTRTALATRLMSVWPRVAPALDPALRVMESAVSVSSPFKNENYDFVSKF